MRIKRLELVGFKSFVDPTVIDFDAPIVGIVGPNGCGKSNIVDAIRWVMGEMSAKSLRGRSMEDVVFNGSESRPPLGLAEVSLTFSTEDGIAPADYAAFTEVTITRRLYRSGESEYLINKIPSRLRDVIDLFLGTGVGHRAYSIIEQGRIDFVINARPEDRRLLIEEAAGVSKFRARSTAALRRVEGTELNLARLKDILNEVTRQIHSLDRQVKKAERYKVLKNELRGLELKLADIKYREMKREQDELKSLLDDWQGRETGSGVELATVESDLERMRLELTERDRRFNSLQEGYFEVSSRLKLLEAQQGFQKKEGIDLEEAKKEAMREIEEMKGRLESLKTEKEGLESRQKSQSEGGSDVTHLLQVAEREGRETEAVQSGLARQGDLLQSEIHQIESQLSRLEGDKRHQEEKRGLLKAQRARRGVEIDEASRRLEDQTRLVESKGAEIRIILELVQRLKGEAEGLKSELASRQERKEILANELALRREELVLKRSRLKSLQDLERNFEGYEEGVRSILRAKKEKTLKPGVIGVVADMIETTPQYEMAVSAALGEKLQYVIVESHEQGIEAINYLKAQSSGRSTFIPMEIREGVEASFAYEQKGVVGPLLKMVHLKEGCQRFGQYLFGDVVVVESLNDALLLWKSNGHTKTLVTLEGEVVDPFGVVSGGTTGIRGKILLEKKREIKELRAIVAELEEEIGIKGDTVSQLEGSLSEFSLNLETAGGHCHEVELKRMALETEETHVEVEARRLEAEVCKLEGEQKGLIEEEAQADSFLTDCDVSRSQRLTTREEREEEIQIVEQDLKEAQKRAKQALDKLTNLKIQAASALEKKAMAERERGRLQENQADLLQRIDSKMATITETHQKMNLTRRSLEEGVSSLETLKKLEAEVAVKQENARGDYEAYASTLQEKESKIRDLRKENDLSRSHTGDLRVTLSRLETELTHLEQRILEKYSVNLSEAASDPLAQNIDMTESEKRVAELKEKLERLGDVSLGAIPEYEELKTRHEFLSRQLQDLEDSLDALKKTIQKINQTTRRRFEETFDLVNERFRALFPKLFQGGVAELRLSEDPGHAQAGVEILVQPPGKKLAHVGLLSGGEKALAAVAFVFAIFLVKPSPFCILDEVDAPLDDINTSRFHRLLSEIVSRTQFILITHNRRTMEKADLLYGVTMQEPGVSQLVSVRLTEDLQLAS